MTAVKLTLLTGDPVLIFCEHIVYIKPLEVGTYIGVLNDRIICVKELYDDVLSRIPWQ